MSSNDAAAPNGAARRNLILATAAFALCFSAWGMLAPLAPKVQDDLGLSNTETAIMIAVPVILGSLLRIPLGWLTDKIGGRVMFTFMLAYSAGAALLIGFATSYAALLGAGFLLGVAGASFAIGIPFVADWYPQKRQGFALGVYGVGNVGTAVAAFSVPFIYVEVGQAAAGIAFAVAIAIFTVIWVSTARDAPVVRHARPNYREVLRSGWDLWQLALFYFVTFGGFVAMAIFLPKLLIDWFDLSLADAGLRAAGFTLLATAARPLGGWLSDRVGAPVVLAVAFAGVGLDAIGLSWQASDPQMLPVSYFCLSMAAFLGAGSGAVFKLVPQRFPHSAGAVTGIVGAAGGLGGFFPPLVMGVVKDATGEFTMGFVFLVAFAWMCAGLAAMVAAAERSAARRGGPAPGTAGGGTVPPPPSPRRPRVLIAGGGIGALEAVLALGEIAGDRLDVTLVTASPRFEYRPLSVAEPFDLGRAYRFELAELLEGRGVDTIVDSVESVDVERRTVHTAGGLTLRYDALLVAIGARREAALPGAIAFNGASAPSTVRRLLADASAGRIERLAFAVPRGVTWSLPAYELALMSAGHLEDHDAAADVALVTPESEPLEAFGTKASAAVEEMLGTRRVRFHSAVPVRVRSRQLLLEHGEPIAADAVVALPRLIPPRLPGLPSDDAGFIPIDEHAAVVGADHVYAAGDATSFPLKQGGMAAQQADAAAEAIAAELGIDIEPTPFRPELRGLLLTGPAPRRLRTEILRPPASDAIETADGDSIPWPPAKVAGRRLAPLLARQGVPPGAPRGAVALELTGSLDGHAAPS